MLAFLLEHLEAILAIGCGLFLFYGFALVIDSQTPPGPRKPEEPDERPSSASYPTGLYID
jgi:hypothetical protein